MSKITQRAIDFSKWYLDVIRECELAELSDVPGCMVIRPRGYAIWESMQRILDGMFKKTGHKNAYFPLFIPKSYLAKEAEHIQGFAKECAVVTHHRLKVEDGKLIVDPEAKLAEELIIRPTSETIIWKTYKNWIQSYRDLPILINQWANVVRWEMRTRMFLRTSEFLWQEGHTAHRTSEEAEAEVLRMIEVYRCFAEDYMAMPVLVGKKTDGERFPGAQYTYTIEAMLQDKKALQAGTSHHLGTTFANAFDVFFLDNDSVRKPVWATSWGVSTRLIGALIMAHSDDKGLVLPPKIAPVQVIIIPIWKTDTEKQQVLQVAHNIKSTLADKGCQIEIDDRENCSPGWKFTDAERTGIPIRIEIGPKDLADGVAVLVRRDTGVKKKVSLTAAADETAAELTAMQTALLERARTFRAENTREINSIDELIVFLDNDGGFAQVCLDVTGDADIRIRDLKSVKTPGKSLGATVRCILPETNTAAGKCIVTGNQTTSRVIVARAY
jgi:prolyl-tRNA synthetase